VEQSDGQARSRDPQPAVPVTQAQAELAVNMAVTLVHTFRSAVT
jgi:hypothetical protein